MPSLSAYEIGQLLAIYEHRIAVQGFIWGINSFDQWGVELGKFLASQVRKSLHASRVEGKPVLGFNSSTASLLTLYLAVEPPTPYNTTTLPKVLYDTFGTLHSAVVSSFNSQLTGEQKGKYRNYCGINKIGRVNEETITK